MEKEQTVFEKPERFIVNEIIRLGLGEVTEPIKVVTGGFLHHMYRVKTTAGEYAFKLLNPEIMSRPDAHGNYERAEELELILEQHGIDIVAAMMFMGKKRQVSEGLEYYVFPWVEGDKTDWNNITEDQCRQAGSVLGKIHRTDEQEVSASEIQCSYEWEMLSHKANETKAPFAALFSESLDMLRYAEKEIENASRCLPDLECITDDDMDPKNVLWVNDKIRVIDLECLGRGNPASSVIQLSLQWAGGSSCEVDGEKLRSFIQGYLEEYDNGFSSYDQIYGLSYLWIDWLNYNVRRATGILPCGEEDRAMAEKEVFETLRRIRNLYRQEKDLKNLLKKVQKSVDF